MRSLLSLLLFGALAVSGCEAFEPPSVSGTISMPDKLQAGLSRSDTLFIVARPAGAVKGPPLAIKRIVGARFPLEYSFDQRDAIMPSRAFEGQVEIKALIRKTGFVEMKAKGDLEGSYPKAVPVGTKGVDFAIDRPSE